MTQLASSLIRSNEARDSLSGVAGVRLIALASACAWCVLLGALFALI